MKNANTYIDDKLFGSDSILLLLFLFCGYLHIS
jgi:hypothetical protein